VIGLVGSGNMARALVRGWGEPVLLTDALPGRAEALAAEVGGEVAGSNAELAERAELVVLCHKPAQLQEVAEQLGGRATRVVSILGGTPLADVKAAHPGAAVARVMPSTPVEVRRGVTCLARDPEGDAALHDEVRERFGRLGPVVVVDEGQIDVATGLMSCAPAYMALVAEAQIDAGVRFGMPADVASQLVVGAMAGSAALLEHRGGDTLAVRREVSSPGGLTARGVAALERGGVRVAFDAAMEAVVGR
jgi:pyrroline-5-carboxylate reductase